MLTKVRLPAEKRIEVVHVSLMRDPKFAVKKEGRKTAVRVFDTMTEASELLETMPAKDKGFIEIRKAEPVRCTQDYCGVSKWCSQYQSYLKEQENE